MKTWFTAKASRTDDEAEIAVYDEIGAFGIGSDAFRDELKALGNVSHINLRINSPGGDVFAGTAIHNMLARHKASITVTIDGIAASIASLVAMAGDAVLMPANAMIMLHNPSGIVVGTADDMEQWAGTLRQTARAMVTSYANKSGMDRDEIADLMAAETWLTAEEAVEMGFADSIEEPVKMAARFDLSKFKNAPKALSRKRSPAATAAPRPTEVIPMTDTPETGAAKDKPATEEITTTTTTITTPKPPAAPIKEPAPDEPETPEQIEAAIAERCANIVAVCGQYGVSERASEFIRAKKSLGEVVATLQTEKAATSPETTTRHRTATADTSASWKAAVDRINNRFVPHA